MLRLDDKWVWDFWLARRDGEHHIFFLQAPRSLGDPELRHFNATIGHAVSADLRDWHVLDDAIAPGPAGSWDDLATWTGSVIEAEGRWWCFYTGVNQAESGLVQRVGAATSSDLSTWTRHPDNPLMELDPQRYEELDLGIWHDQAWRDPWVIQINGRYEVLTTARSADGVPDGRGVIGHAWSHDLIEWHVGDPLRVDPPGQFGQLEVPQVVEIEGRWYLLFASGADTHSAAWRDRGIGVAQTGTFYAVGDHPTGPFTLADTGPLGPDDGSVTYSGRIATTDDGPMFLAWRALDASGEFVGEIIDPMRVTVDDGKLTLQN